jgi:type I restriction enzyme, S subunit
MWVLCIRKQPCETAPPIEPGPVCPMDAVQRISPIPVALAEIPMAINQDMKAIIPGPRLDPDFLLYAITAFKKRLFEKVGRSAHGTMTLMSSEITSFQIPLPDKNTQRQIANSIATLEKKYELHQRKRATLTDLFRSLLHQLMTAQIRVNDLDMSEIERKLAA